MSIISGPKVSTEELLFSVDSANQKSYSGTGTSWSNLKNSNSATLINGVTFNSSNKGYFIFDGVNDMINTGYDLSWNNTNSISISLFVKPSTTTKVAGIIGKPSPDWEWVIMQDGTLLRFIYWNTGGGHTNGPIIELSNFFNSTSNWINITLTWSHTSNKVKIYKNSILLNESTWVNASINQNRTNSVYLGGGIYSWNTGYWSGLISKVNFYNKELTQEEVKQNFEAIRGRYGI